jgi:hypothetical protein
VAAYGFDEASGTTALDSVDTHNGTISGATRVAGRFGQGLSFDGVNDWVTIPHSPGLNLASGLTLEAWVRPTALTTWRSVVMKENVGQLAYALYASNDVEQPLGSVFTSSALSASGPPTLGLSTWTHLAMTWDGGTIRLYVDSALVAGQPTTGSLLTGTGSLRIGGNSVRSEFFSGVIDEVRVYDRALSAARITADMAAPVGG